MASASNPAGSNATLRILFFYAAAIALGVLNGFYGTDLTIRAGDFLSSVFIRLFKFISIPIIAVSLISTLAQLGESRESGQIFRRTIFYTLFTTIIAATVAAALFLLYAPANVSLPTEAGNVPKVVEHSYFEYVQSVIPDNFLSPFLSANVISVLLVASAVGLALSQLEKDSRPKEVLTAFFAGAQQILFILVSWLIKILPLGIFGFVTVLCRDLQAGVSLGGLGTYFAAIITANLLQIFVILPAILLVKGISPVKTFRAMLPALTVAFFSKSSAGTLPVTMRCAEENMRVRKSVSGFVLPICTTINMNACAAFILITCVYLMQNAGAEITIGTLASWILIATVAAVGNAGVPMGCFFLAASLLASMNVPILLMGVILPFYAVLDMLETAENVWSDSCVAKMVDKDLYGEPDEP